MILFDEEAVLGLLAIVGEFFLVLLLATAVIGLVAIVGMFFLVLLLATTVLGLVTIFAFVKRALSNYLAILAFNQFFPLLFSLILQFIFAIIIFH